jgi:apolipoprotein N-acyltransferase
LNLKAQKIDISWLWAGASGLLGALSFPPFNLSFLSCIFLLPLLWAIEKSSRSYAFKLGFFAAVCYFSVLLWWLVPTLARFGAMELYVATPIIGLLVLYLSLFWGIWALFWVFLQQKGLNIWSIAITTSALWGCLEWCIGVLFSGFPWGNPVYSLANLPHALQLLEVIGVHGLAALLILLNVSIWYALHLFRRAKFFQVIGIVIALGGAIALLFSYGHWRMTRVKAEDGLLPFIPVAVLQGAFPMDVKWRPEFQEETVSRYIQLARDALNEMQQKGMLNDLEKRHVLPLMVLPETAAPFYFQELGPAAQRLLFSAYDLNVWMLFGSLAYVPSLGGTRPMVGQLNSAYLIDSQPKVLGRYDKRHLVPFGEYLPLNGALEWIREIFPTAGDFLPGVAENLVLRANNLRIGVLICFESIFPEMSAEMTRAGAQILAVITNDAWFGHTGAPYQHEAMSVFRAIETRRWVLMSNNTGISSIITPWGERVGQTRFFEPDYLVATAHLAQDVTSYAAWGYVAVPAFLVLVVGVGFFLAYRRSDVTE